jgi:hypothetical protein
VVRSLRGVCEASKTATRPAARNGGEVKAVGIVSPTALLFEQATQYKISKIKLSISTIAVTPATESTKASLACHSYLFESGVEMAFDARYRDKDGEISRKYGNALVDRLRTSYGGGFAQGCANDDKLSDVLAKLDEQSLYKLVRDYKSGMLPVRLRTPWMIAPQP